MESMSERQGELLEFIREYRAARGVGPSYAEIAARFGYRSLATVHDHLGTLVARGWIRKQHRRARSLEVVERPAEGPASVGLPPAGWLVEECGEYPLPPLPETAEVSPSAVRRYREQWRSLRGRLGPGERLWTFREPSSRGPRAGYAVVREGRVVGGVVTHEAVAEC